MVGRNVFIVWAAFLLLYSFGPFSFRSLGWEFYLIVSIFLCSVFVGEMLGRGVLRFDGVFQRRLRNGRIVHSIDRRHLSLFFWISFAYLFVAVFNAYSKGVLDVGITEARYQGISDGVANSPISAAGHLIFGAPVILLCMLIYASAYNGWRKIGYWSMAVLSVGSYFLSGGRNAFAISIVILLVFSLAQKGIFRDVSASTGVRKKRGGKFRLILLVSGIIFSLYLFAERGEIRGETALESIRRMAWDNGIDVYVPELMSTGFAAALYGVVLFLIYYLVHSFQFFYDYLSIGYSPYLLGVYSYNFIFRVLEYLLGTNFSGGAMGRLLISGVYLSMPGSFYVDFGVFGVFFKGLLFGFFAGLFRVLALRHGRFEDIFLFSLFAGSLYLSPIYSVTNVSNGLSLFFLGFLFKFSRLNFTFK